MKRIILTFACLAVLLYCGGCRKKSPDPAPQPTPATATPAVTVEIRADSTDIVPDYHYVQANADAKFSYEENYFVQSEDYCFTLKEGFSMASYQTGSYPIYDSRINGVYMCTASHNYCDSTQTKVASLWDRVGSVPLTRRFTWDYVTRNQDKRYVIRMGNLPKPVVIEEVPSVLLAGNNPKIRFQRGSVQDTVLVELIVFEKSDLLKSRVIPFIPHARIEVMISPQGDEVVVPANVMTSLKSYFANRRTADTAFVNVASVRKVIKKVDGQKMLLSYQINQLRPLRIQ